MLAVANETLKFFLPAIKVELLATIIAETLGPIEWLAVKLLWELLSTRVVLLGKGRVHIRYRLGLKHGCKWCKRGGRI